MDQTRHDNALRSIGYAAPLRWTESRLNHAKVTPLELALQPAQPEVAKTVFETKTNSKELDMKCMTLY